MNDFQVLWDQGLSIFKGNTKDDDIVQFQDKVGDLRSWIDNNGDIEFKDGELHKITGAGNTRVWFFDGRLLFFADDRIQVTQDMQLTANVEMRNPSNQSVFTLTDSSFSTYQLGSNSFWLLNGAGIMMNGAYSNDGSINNISTANGFSFMLHSDGSGPASGYNGPAPNFQIWSSQESNPSLNNTLIYEVTKEGYDVLPEIGTYLNDAAADADPNLPSGGRYLITGNRTVFQKP